MANNVATNTIPQETYAKILDAVPIPCVDVIARFNNQFLLLKRNNPPAQKEWWLPGGRILKGESMKDAAIRKLKEETNLTGTVAKTLGPYETFFKEAPFGIKTGVHSINVVFLIDVQDITSLMIDRHHLAYTFFSTIQENWHPYLKQVLKDCGF